MKRALFFFGIATGLVIACGSSSSGGGVGVGGDAGNPGSDAGGADGSNAQSDGSTGTDGSPSPGMDAQAPSLWNVTNESVTVGAASRTYVLSVPKNYDASKAYPMVIVFHGDGGDGAGLRSYYFFEGASGTDAIVVYPDGQNNTWDLYDTPGNNADFDFMSALITKVAGSYNVDKTKVFGTGWSNGAFFVNELACNEPGLLAAIAPNSGGAPNTDQANWPLNYSNNYFKCVNGEVPVPAFIVQGAVDTTVTKDSGEFDGMYWAYVNGCQQTTTATTPSPCTQYDGCPSGLSVVYCEIPGMGHAVWQNTATGAWAFFKAVKP